EFVLLICFVDSLRNDLLREVFAFTGRWSVKNPNMKPEATLPLLNSLRINRDARQPALTLLRAGHPLVGSVNDLEGKATLAKCGDHQSAARVGRIGLRLTGRTECHQATEVEVRA